jgi:glutamate-1-semialdehyde 2,1-aminomutase
MTYVAPSGPIYQAGTLSGNPLAVSAGLAMLRHIQAHPEIYDAVDEPPPAAWPPARRRRHGEPGWLDDDLVLHRPPVTDYDTAKHSDTNAFKKFFHAMMERGIYLPPSQFEAFSSPRPTHTAQIAARFTRCYDFGR